MEWIILAINVQPLEEDGELSPGTLKTWVSTALNTAQIDRNTLLASAGPAGILLCFRNQATEAPKRFLQEMSKESAAYRPFRARAAVARGAVAIVKESWLTLNFEGRPAVIAARLIANALPGELILHESVGSLAKSEHPIEEIPGKHEGESFAAHRWPGYFDPRPDPGSAGKTPKGSSSKGKSSQSKSSTSTGDSAEKAKLANYLVRYRNRLGGQFDRMEMKLLGPTSALDGRGKLLAPSFDAMYLPLRVSHRLEAERTDPGFILSKELILSGRRPAIVIGQGGSGKTTWTRHIFRSVLQTKEFVPILLILRDLCAAWKKPRSDTSKRSIDSFIVDSLDHHELSGPEITQVIKGQAGVTPVLIVDGWDELGPIGEEIRTKLMGFTREYHNLKVVATSRPYGEGKPTHSDGFDELYVQPLSPAEIGTFATNFFRACHGADSEQVRQSVKDFEVSLERLPEAADLVRTPLLLAMMLSISRSQTLPDKRYKLYSACIDNLLNEVPTTYEQEGVQTRAEVWRPDDSDKRKLGFASLAWKMQVDGYSKKGRASIVLSRDTAAGLLPAEWSEKERSGFLSWLVERAGVLVDRSDGTLMFAHLSFQEFLSAWHLKASERGDDKILAAFLTRCEQSGWWETLRLAGALLHAEGASGPLLSGLTGKTPAAHWLAGSLFADGLADDQSFKGWLDELPSTLLPTVDPHQRLCSRAWHNSRSLERERAVEMAVAEIGNNARWGQWLAARGWYGGDVPPPSRGLAARLAAFLDGSKPWNEADACSCGRFFLAVDPLFPGGELGLLHLWLGSRRIRGIQLQNAALAGIAREDLPNLKSWLLPVESQATRLNPLSEQARLVLGGVAPDVTYRTEVYLGAEQTRIASYLNKMLFHIWTIYVEIGRWRTSDSHIPRSFKELPSMSLGVSAALVCLDDLTGALLHSPRASLAEAHVEGHSPLVDQMQHACRHWQRFHEKPSDADAPAFRGNRRIRFWSALARHIALCPTDADKKLLTQAARFPEKLPPPLNLGVQFIVRGDILLDDGSVVTLDELCDEAGLPHLPYLNG